MAVPRPFRPPRLRLPSPDRHSRREAGPARPLAARSRQILLYPRNLSRCPLPDFRRWISSPTASRTHRTARRCGAGVYGGRTRVISTVVTAAAAAPNAPSILLAVGRLVDAPTSTVHHRKLYQHSFGEDDRRRGASLEIQDERDPSVCADNVQIRIFLDRAPGWYGTGGVHIARAHLTHTHTYTRARVCGDSC